MLPILLFLASLVLSSGVAARELYIAAAADLIYCLDDVNRAFQQAHPSVRLKVSTGSSGNFYAQIRNGAPFDVFMSADLLYPRKLIEAGMADSSTLLRYAIGRIALWTLDSKLDISDGLKSLTQPSVHRVAIANPAHAPYGQAARAALQHDGLWDTIAPKLIKGDNIAQTAQFVQTGNADVGIVALSLLKSPRLANLGHYVVIPQDKFPTLEQGAVITRQGLRNPLAYQYMAFLASPPARAIFERYGFMLPDKAQK
jgi:molybdate transport system substrate-binding protein